MEFAGKQDGNESGFITMTEFFSTCAEMKARQARKIRELRTTLCAAVL